jgi:hypothetical protein
MINKLLCWLFGHKKELFPIEYNWSGRTTYGFRITCERCKKIIQIVYFEKI